MTRSAALAAAESLFVSSAAASNGEAWLSVALRELLAQISPNRRHVHTRGDGGARQRKPLMLASPLELLEALRTDVEAAVHHAPPAENAYKDVERRFRFKSAHAPAADDDFGAGDGAAGAAGAAALSPADTAMGAAELRACVSRGALDFAAPWRSDAGEREARGVCELVAPASRHCADSARAAASGDACAAAPPARSMLEGGLYALERHPGVYILPTCLSTSEQEYWARRALRGYIEPPNRRNIDGHVDPDASTLQKFGKSTLAPALRAAAAAAGAGAMNVAAVAAAAAAEGVAASASASAGTSTLDDTAGVAADRAAAGDTPSLSLPALALQRGLWRRHLEASAIAAECADALGSPAPHALRPAASAALASTALDSRGGASSSGDVCAELCFCAFDGADGAAASGAASGIAAAAATAAATAALDAVSWATLGTQYDWTARVYHLPSDPDFAAHARPSERAPLEEETHGGAASAASLCPGGASAALPSAVRAAERCGRGEDASGPAARAALPLLPARVARGSGSGATASSAERGAQTKATTAAAAAASSRWCVPFPADLHAWAAQIAAAVGGAAARAHAAAWHRGGACSDGRPLDSLPAFLAARGLPMSLSPQAGIVNVYAAAGGRRLPMGAHVDDMERDFAFPVVSASLGCAALFLVGGGSKETPPTPLLLRSGDVLLLSGASRRTFHGVARTLPGTAPRALFGGCEGERASPPPLHAHSTGLPRPCAAAARALASERPLECPVERRAFRAFLARARINLNVRQIAMEL